VLYNYMSIQVILYAPCCAGEVLAIYEDMLGPSQYGCRYG
jgi:hypothetical protein